MGRVGHRLFGNVQLLFSAVMLFLVAGCASKPAAPDTSGYSVDSLAKDWRAEVRKNPNNPYEGKVYPQDNDSDYTPPKKLKKISPIDNEDSSYGKFPRYNPDDDNAPIDPKKYPLYFDNM